MSIPGFDSHEVVGERQDDLPCYECGEYGDTLIVRVRDGTRDMCRRCVAKLEWKKTAGSGSV
jgi:hypothetical protein